jgi:steroid delta-isomerase-like uncharacterized protein
MGTTLQATELDRLIDEHFQAELDENLDAIVSTFALDIEHDFVGNPQVSHGRAEAAAFYRELFTNLHLDRFETVHRYHGDDFVVDESIVHATAIGSPFGIPGQGRVLHFRLLHIFDVRDGLIARENAWLDVASVMAQLTS